MGMFQQFKQLRETTAALPGMMAEVGALRGAAENYAGQASVAAPAAGIPADDPRLAPIAGIDLATYAGVVKASVQAGRPAETVAVERGLDGDSWLAAAAAWPARMTGDLALAVQYGNLYAAAL